MLEILHIALRSHRDALNLQQDNADVLFNTAQVLTSLAESITEGKHPSEQRSHEATKHLQEALELFQRCLTLQELRFTESQEQIKAMESGALEQEATPDQPPGPEIEADPTAAPVEQWVSVMEPVTRNTLVDTAVAQLETLATFCGLLTSDPGSSLAWVEEYSADLLQRIAAYAENTDRQGEVKLARAKFIASLAEVSYRSGRIDLDTYKNELSSVFGEEDLNISGNPEGLCSKAEALVGFNSAVAECHVANDQASLNSWLGVRWQSLSTALDCLTAASKLENADNLAKIHIARGDVEVYRWRLGRPPWDYTLANENASLLLSNAQTYYRGGAAIAKRDGLSEEEREGTTKDALAKGFSGDLSHVQQLLARARDGVMQLSADMVEDGLVATADMQTLFSNAEPEEIVF